MEGPLGRIGRGTRRPTVSPREREVLVGVARGLTNAKLSRELFIGEATVKTHVGNLLTKLGCRYRVQLVVRAHESGVVAPGDGTGEREDLRP